MRFCCALLGAQLFTEEGGLFLGLLEHTPDHAKRCHLSANSTHAFKLRSVWLLPNRWHEKTAGACAAGDRPGLCDSYDPDLFRWMSRVIGAPERSFSRSNSLSWERLQSDETPQQGDLRDGSLCPPRGELDTIRYMMGRPTGGNGLIMRNLRFPGAAFSDLDTEDARKLTRQAIDAALSVRSHEDRHAKWGRVMPQSGWAPVNLIR